MRRLFGVVKDKKSQFLRNVLTLMTGTTIAQAIPIAAMPLLTRLYTPQEFGALALYLSITSMIAVVVNARYEVAIMLPKLEEDAASLVVLSAGIAAVVALVLLAIITIFDDEIFRLFNNDSVGSWLYLVPFTVLVIGLWQAFNYWNNRAKKFKRLAISRVAQGGGMTAAQFALGGIQGGLILGYVVGQIVALSVFLTRIWREDRKILSNVTAASIKKNAADYSKFPKYSSVGALLNSAATQMPVLVLSRFFEAFIVGTFSLTFRAMNLPVSLIGASCAQVLFPKFVSIHQNAPHDLPRYVVKVFVLLSLGMVPIVGFVYLFGKDLFGFVFGEAWSSAGEYASILVFAIAIRFAVSPLSTVLVMEHNVKIGTFWQVLYFITVTVTLFYYRDAGIKAFILAYTLHDLILYSLYFGLILYGASRNGNDASPSKGK